MASKPQFSDDSCQNWGFSHWTCKVVGCARHDGEGWTQPTLLLYFASPSQLQTECEGVMSRFVVRARTLAFGLCGGDVSTVSPRFVIDASKFLAKMLSRSWRTYR